jgi:hypothetical protein
MKDMVSAENHQLIFVGGLHRSGTTALYQLLGSDPDVSVFNDTGVIEDEGQFLQKVVPSDEEHGGPGHFCFDSSAHLTETSEYLEVAQDSLFQQWSEYWDLRKPILAEKTPANLIRSRFLQTVFPGSSFVFMMRHPVAACMATTKWTGAYMTRLIEHWIKAHDLLLEDLEYLDNAVVLRYEDFTRYPEEFEADLTRVLGKSPNVDWSMIRSGLNEKYYRRWREGDFHLKDQFSTLKKWLKKRRNIAEVMSIRFKYEEKIRRFGYSFDNLL